MAALSIKQDDNNRLVLETPASQRVSNLFEVLVAAIIALSIFAPYLENRSTDPLALVADNPIVLIMVLVALYIVGRAIYGIVSGTRVVVDSSARRVARTTTLLGLPINRAELPFDGIQDVRVGSTLPVTFTGTATRKVWQLTLDSSGRSPFLLNSKGLHDEMRVLAGKVANLTGRPLVDELEQAGQAAQADQVFQPIHDFGGGGGRSALPPVAAPGRLGRQITSSQLPEKNPPPNTLAPDSDSEEHKRFEEQMGELGPTPVPPTQGEVQPPSYMPAPPVMGAPVASGSEVPPSMPPLSMPLQSGEPVTGPISPNPAGQPGEGIMPTMPSLGAAGESSPSYSSPALGGSGMGLEMGSTFTSAPLEMGPVSMAETPGSTDVSGTNPPPRPAQAGRAWVHLRSYEELQKAIADDPNDSRAYYELARLWHARRDYKQALAAYTQAIHLDPTDAVAQNDLGVLYLQRGKLREAEAAFRRAVGLDPFFMTAHYNLGVLLTRTGRRQEAMQAFTRGLQTAGSDAERELFENAQKGIMGEARLSQQ